ncbi:MAG: HD-GYP domain-containing protein [Actinomycetota bacterium]
MRSLTAARPQTAQLSHLIVTVTAALICISAGISAIGSAPNITLIATFGTIIMIGEVLRISLTRNRQAAPISTAAGFALALIDPCFDGTCQTVDSATIIVASALAITLGYVPHALRGDPDTYSVIRRFLSLAFLVLLWRTIPWGSAGALADITAPWQDRSGVAILMTCAVSVILCVDVLIGALLRPPSLAPWWSVLRDEARATAGISAAIGSAALLLALAMRPLGLLAVPIFLIPMMVTQFSFRRYASINATYRQTIRSLSALTDLGGYTTVGHSRRVSALAVSIGYDLGLNETDMEDLERAALLHDIGQLSLTDPIAGGKTTPIAPSERRRIAALGADIIGRTGVLDRVAFIVERQAEPYRRRHDINDNEVPVASRIIKVANAYDDLVGNQPSPSQRREALERLHLGLAYEYDPSVVTALTALIKREHDQGRQARRR